MLLICLIIYDGLGDGGEANKKESVEKTPHCVPSLFKTFRGMLGIDWHVSYSICSIFVLVQQVDLSIYLSTSIYSRSPIQVG